MAVHQRTVIREAAAKWLYDDPRIKAIVGDNVFVSRKNAISSDQELPCICVDTPREETEKKKSESTSYQDLTLTVDIYVKRSPDMHNPWRVIDGMPNNPNTAHFADRLRDELALYAEEILLQKFLYTDIFFIENGEQDCVSVNQYASVNTDIEHSSDGQLPYTYAGITFSLQYDRTIEREQVDCNFNNFTIDFNHKTCGDDPMDDKVAVSAAAWDFKEDA